MDTKAIRGALGNYSRENEEEYYGLDKDSARELIFTTEQLLDENERLQERVKHFIRCANSNRGALWERNAEIVQLQADKAVAVEALVKIREMTPYGLYREIIDAALERIESGEKG